MQIPALLLQRRPALKSRRVAHHTGKVPVVQEIQHGVFLLQARPVQVVVRAEGPRAALVGGQLVVALDEARADHEDVADADVAALGGWAEVEALGFRAGLQVCVGDGVLGVRVVGDGVGFGVVSVVEEDAAAGDAVGGPVVGAAGVGVGVGAEDVGAFCLFGFVV